MSLHPDDAGRPKWTSTEPWSAVQHTPGAYPPSPRPESFTHVESYQTIAQAVRARKDEYTRKKTIKAKIGTWNVAALSGTEKDLGGWFAKGFGVKGLTQDLSGLHTGDEEYKSDSSEDEVESVEDQEARQKKKSSTLPQHDSAALPSGDEVDLYVLGLQEVIDIASMTEAVKPYTDPNPARRWKSALRRSLPRGYKKVVEQQLLGLLLLVYASPKLKSEVSFVDSTSVGTGLMGYLGNKGAVSARLLLGETTRMVFVNCHLAAGADSGALTRRIWDTNQILSRTKFSGISTDGQTADVKSESIGDEDFAFWFGDLNYRLDDIPGEDVRRLLLLHTRNEYDVLNKSKRKIDSELGYREPSTDTTDPVRDESNHIENPASDSTAEPPLDPKSDPASLLTTLHSLLAHDQLHAQQRNRKAFHDGWKEGDINFLPTYKYDVGSVAMFDSGEKKRSPSWCDRILWRTRLDRLMYAERAKKEEEARKKDEEMKKRGLDDAASQEDVLFDYDPENDGNDYFDDVDEDEAACNDIEMIRTQDGLEDAIQLEEYISHQRVLSSDHKPLSAVFNITYDSVVPELKQRVYQEVAKQFDKAENEARPNVTVVLDHGTNLNMGTDSSADAHESKVLDYGDVRYDVSDTRSFTIANTGQIEVSFAFVSRPSSNIAEPKTGAFPEWISMHIDREIDRSTGGSMDLGTAAKYKLHPGETTNVELTCHIRDPLMVKQLNKGDFVLDDVLVLRISNGRDYFIPVKGSWLQSCFYRSIDELVRVPAGVRALTMRSKDAETQHQPSTNVQHSAPKELFVLTDAIPNLVERLVAEWDMIHNGLEPPWKDNPSWPFTLEQWTTSDPYIKSERLAEVREALDTATSFDDHLNHCTDPSERLELLVETLTTFLTSLEDGIITNEIWSEIEPQMIAAEKSKTAQPLEQIQEITMEALSKTPIHSVSLTFLSFMLNRTISELAAANIDPPTAASSPLPPTSRSRSSTSASRMSEVSLSSETSSITTKRAFLPSLMRPGTNSSLLSSPVTPTTPIAPATPAVRKQEYCKRYAEIFAPLLIRSGDTAKMKNKEKKAQEARKVKVIESFLDGRQ